MFFPIRFKTHVQLVPHELDENIEKTIITKLKKRYEGVCSRFGYIKPDTLQILSRSLGSFMKPHFNGHTRFEVLLLGEVCNPTPKMVVTATVQAKNNLGILAESSVFRGGNMSSIPLLDIIIPRRSAGIASEVDLETIAIGESVYVEVLGKRYQLNDTKISIIGRIVKEQKNAANEIDGDDDESGVEDDNTELDEDDEIDDNGDDVDGADGDGEEKVDSDANIADAKRFARLLREGVNKTNAKDDDDDEEEEEEEDGVEELDSEVGSLSDVE